MIVFLESEKMPESGNFLKFSVRKILIDNLNFTVYHRPDKDSNEIKKFIEFYCNNISKEGGKTLNFSIEVMNEKKALNLTGNFDDIVFALSSSNLISNKTKEEILQSKLFKMTEENETTQLKFK